MFLAYLFGRLFELSEEEFSDCTVKSQIPVTSDLSSLGTAALGPLINKPAIRDIDIIGIGGSGSTDVIFNLHNHLLINSLIMFTMIQLFLKR